MDAQTLLTFLVAYLDEGRHGEIDCQPPRFDPRRVGPFGTERTDRYTQTVMIDGTRFHVTVEKDPNQ